MFDTKLSENYLNTWFSEDMMNLPSINWIIETVWMYTE